jgi:cytochrome c-type biogenesis protein CcmH/NrfG
LFGLVVLPVVRPVVALWLALLLVLLLALLVSLFFETRLWQIVSVDTQTLRQKQNTKILLQ